MKNQVNIGLIGFGVVGSGTLQLIKQHKKDIEARVGAPVKVIWLCSLEDNQSKWIDSSIRQTKNWRDVISDPRVDCIVELIGGTNPARQLVGAALNAGKHVVTANKAILAKHWDEIFGLAHRKKRLVYFEASVGGGIPVIQALNEGLAGNEIQKMVGILNGTTNYILTKMLEAGVSFQEALKNAQQSGFAEANPTFDVEGVDTAQKISILGSLALGRWVNPKRVYCEGITHIQPEDMQLAKSLLKSTIKLMAIAEQTSRGWVFRVHPTLVPNSHPFANVRNEYNAVMLKGNAVDDVMLYGKGAGKFPAASAVLSDIIFISRHIANQTADRIPYVVERTHKKVRLASMSKVKTRYYMRVTTVDKPGVLAKISSILGRNNVSLASVHQDVPDNGKSGRSGVSILLLTHVVPESKVMKSIKSIDRLPTTRSKTVMIRME
jgi:homoserine dehydrogenase